MNLATDLVHASAAVWAFAFFGLATVLHCNVFSISHLTLGFAFYTIGFDHKENLDSPPCQRY